MFFPLQLVADWVTYHIFALEKGSYLAETLNFFIFDTLKIFIMLFVLLFCISFLRNALAHDRLHTFLKTRKPLTSSLWAALIGVITPFCSCSAIPLFLTFIKAGVPIGSAFAFLIASPMINEVAIILLFGFFGLKITCLYILSGLMISIFSGLMIGKIKRPENWLKKDILFSASPSSCACRKTKNKFRLAIEQTFDILKKIWLYVIIGIGIGAWIHGYVPQDLLLKYAKASKWYDVPVSVILGVPLYSNAAGVFPMISSLVEKGVSLGTALAFMMAVTGLSFPEFLILKRIMNLKLLLTFASIVALGIIFTGYLFNMLI